MKAETAEVKSAEKEELAVLPADVGKSEAADSAVVAAEELPDEEPVLPKIGRTLS